MGRILLAVIVILAVVSLGDLPFGVETPRSAQAVQESPAEQRAKAVEAAKRADSPAQRPLTAADVNKYCAAQEEIVRARREDLKAGQTLSSAESKERTRKLAEKNGLTLDEYTFISLRLNRARLYSTLNLCPDPMKADCELYKKHQEQILAAQKAE